MTDKAQTLIDELVSAAIAFGRGELPDWQTRIEKAQRELREHIDELEAEIAETRCDEIYALSGRIVRLEAFIDQLIEAGDDVALVAKDIFEFDGKSGEFMPIAEKWQALVKDWKEG